MSTLKILDTSAATMKKVCCNEINCDLFQICLPHFLMASSGSGCGSILLLGETPGSFAVELTGVSVLPYGHTGAVILVENTLKH